MDSAATFGAAPVSITGIGAGFAERGAAQMNYAWIFAIIRSVIAAGNTAGARGGFGRHPVRGIGADLIRLPMDLLFNRRPIADIKYMGES